MQGRRRFRKLRMATEGSLELHKIIEHIVAGQGGAEFKLFLFNI